MSRIFKQFANGYGPTPVEIVAQIDGNTVYSGTVPTIDGPVPSFIPPTDPFINPHAECFSWTEDSGNASTRSISITVVNGDGVLQLGQTLAQETLWGNGSYIDPYNVFYRVELEGPTGNFVYGDPFSNVVIDGEPQTRPLEPYSGQWYRIIPAGSTLTATINVNVPPLNDLQSGDG